jgi:hypothetical protein
MRVLGRLVCALALGMTTPALAFQCETPDFLRDFRARQAAAETYQVAYGRFTSYGPLRHDVSADAMVSTARFKGYTASTSNFDQPFESAVMVVFPLYTGISQIAQTPDSIRPPSLAFPAGVVFLQKTEDGFRLDHNECVSFVYIDPAEIRQALNCVNGRNCPNP